jgi:hypothetical protein
MGFRLGEDLVRPFDKNGVQLVATAQLITKEHGVRIGVLMKRLAVLLVLPLAILLFFPVQLLGAPVACAGPTLIGANGPISIMGCVAVFDRTGKLDPAVTAKYLNTKDSIQIALANGRYSEHARHALGAATFADETTLEHAVNAGTCPAGESYPACLPEGTGAVIYDAESWHHTPDVQKESVANLRTYYRRAAAAAHSHRPRLLLIATPATDLVDVLSPGLPFRERFDEFIKLRIPAAAARYADVYESQGQGLEDDTSAYASFTLQAAQQAKAANPNVKPLGGLSTNPNGKEKSAQVLDAAADATAGIVAGWWINDPSHGDKCMQCQGPFAQMIVDFLKGL